MGMANKKLAVKKKPMCEGRVRGVKMSKLLIKKKQKEILFLGSCLLGDPSAYNFNLDLSLLPPPIVKYSEFAVIVKISIMRLFPKKEVSLEPRQGVPLVFGPVECRENPQGGGVFFHLFLLRLA